MIDIGLILIAVLNLVWYAIMRKNRLPLWAWIWFPAALSVLAGIVFTEARTGSILHITAAIWAAISVVTMLLITFIYRKGDVNVVNTPFLGVAPFSMAIVTIFQVTLGYIP